MPDTTPGSAPVRLLYVRDTLTVCGPGKTILNTWRTLDPERYQMLIVSTKPAEGKPNEFLEAARRLGAPTHELTIGRGIDLVAVADLVRLIRTHQIDILQTHDAQTRRLGVIAAALTGVCHVSSVHGWIFNDRKERAAKWVDGHLLRMAHAVIAVSDRLRHELIGAGVPQKRLTLLRNAVVLKDYPRVGSTHATATFRAQLALREGDLVVSIVGRLSAEKGHEDFLQCARLVIQTVPRARFLIVGDGPLRESLAARVAALGLGSQVTFTGHQDNLAELYAVTDVLAISSHTEGIPNVLLEAFAYATPAVATCVGGVPEVLEDGKTGYLVPPHQPALLAERLIRLLRDADLRDQMGIAARHAIEQQFNFLERTRSLERLYEGLDTRRRRQAQVAS
jgi:glycosyltransferase involved in cell wall biosynthesis